jgi:hypothetical protein
MPVLPALVSRLKRAKIDNGLPVVFDSPGLCTPTKTASSQPFSGKMRFADKQGDRNEISDEQCPEYFRDDSRIGPRWRTLASPEVLPDSFIVKSPVGTSGLNLAAEPLLF